ncbi:MAG: hypothetical protein A2Y71_09140 [Bacteroidetes bacterium RBG_13_42_15]|nr:MAG: hypothetical protein A2Y71_09140 [Bacteroidetes bacterium RBG_13_42_15]
MNLNRYIGCCGAYCKTCKPYIEGFCKGCKLGYDSGKRDIKEAKCRIKVCCFGDKKLDTCADCVNLYTCPTIGNLFAHNGYKYQKYKQAIEFIKENGYSEFIKIADKWKNAYGKYE